MENKYYIPKIEELSVGQECEISWNFGELKENSFGEKYDDTYFYKEIITPQFIDLFNNEKYFSIRFKYLDREDIESLGFRFWKIHPGTTTHEFETSDGRYNITFDPEWGNNWNCTIQDEVDFTFFHGYVKNKNELKVILKQVGIINE